MTKRKPADDIKNPLHMPFEKAIHRVIAAEPYPTKNKPTAKRLIKSPWWFTR